MANQASAELFLDILTKEEREALLSKKMEEIRKKNEALRKRHEEIQNDKKAADQSLKTSTEFSSNSQIIERQANTPKKTNKSFGRGKPRPKSGGDFNHVQDIHIIRSPESRNVQLKDDNDRFQREEFNFRHDTPKRFSFGDDDHPKDFRFGEHDDRDANRNHSDRRGGRNFRGRGGHDRYKENYYNRQDSRKSNEDYYDKRDFRNSGDFSPDFRGRGRGRNDHYNRQNSRSSGDDFHDKRDFRNSGDFSRNDSRGQNGQNRSGNQYNRQGSRDSTGNRYSGEFNRNNYKEKREQFDDSEFEPTRKRPHGGSHNNYNERPDGPPPDPAYNFLSDRSREGPQQQDRSDKRDPHRRHPKNFGGQDFSNVKNQIKNVKERQPRSGPPKSKMEMAVTMTGRERRQYIEWKADRDKVDNARIERQKSSSGEWKREWDKEKIETEDIKQTEPVRRPAGRIGSGRFDRGEKDERQKGHPEEGSRLNLEKGRHHPESPTKVQNGAPARGRGNKHAEMPPRMAGRGRGRGRGKAKSANEAKPQRVRSTSSGDERVVNCDSDLLVIKLDNTPGDNSVEVEYSDGEVPAAKSSRSKQTVGSTATHGAQTEELWWDEDDDLTMSLIQDGLADDDVLEHRQLFDDADRDGSHEVVVGDDEDEWEDCDDDSFYSTEKSQTSTDSREGYHDNQLRVNTQLNPDAPEFTPISPVSPISPRSPREKRSKKHSNKNDSGQSSKDSSSNKTPKDEKHVNKDTTNSKEEVKNKDSDNAIKGTEIKGQKVTQNSTSHDIDGQEATEDTVVSNSVKTEDKNTTDDTDVSNSVKTEDMNTTDDKGVSNYVETEDKNITDDTDVSNYVAIEDQEVPLKSDTNVSQKLTESLQDGDKSKMNKDPQTKSSDEDSTNDQKAHSETAKDAVDNTESVATDEDKTKEDCDVDVTTNSEDNTNTKQMADSETTDEIVQNKDENELLQAEKKESDE